MPSKHSVRVRITKLIATVRLIRPSEYAIWRIYFLNKLSKLIKSALLVPKSTIGTRP